MGMIRASCPVTQFMLLENVHVSYMWQLERAS